MPGAYGYSGRRATCRYRTYALRFSLRPGNHEFCEAADEIVFGKWIARDDVTADIPLNGFWFADGFLLRFGSGTGEPRTGNTLVGLRLGETGQQVGFSRPLCRRADAGSVGGLQPPDLLAPGALGRPLEVPEGVGIQEILSLTARAS